MSYLLEVYKDFKKEYPQIARAYSNLVKACHGW